MSKDQGSSRWLKPSVERIVFFVFLGLYALPLLTTKVFVTVDGPAHLHNARLLLELFNGNETIASNYVFNPAINPNLIGHGILALLMTILPAWLAEKTLLVTYVILMPLAFRYFYLSTKPGNRMAMYLIFPLTYSYLFYFGFYNFNTGLILLFFLLGRWLTIESLTPKKIVSLTLLSTLLFFSHLFVFGVFGIVWGSYFIAEQVQNKRIDYRRLGLYVLTVTPGLILAIGYLSSGSLGSSDLHFMSTSEIMLHLRELGPMKGISLGRESQFVRPFAMLWLLFLGLGSLGVIRKNQIHQHLASIITVVVLFALLFILPDGTSSFGFVSFRLMLFVMLFTIVFTGRFESAKWLSWTGFVLAASFGLLLLNIYLNASIKLNRVSNELYSLQSKLKPGVTVLPIGASDQWVHGHVSNYLGTSEGRIILENYEASLDYFPINWNYEKQANYFYGSDGCRQFANHIGASNNPNRYVDYLLIFDMEQVDRCSLDAYDVYYKSENGFVLYQRLDADSLNTL